jgi:hypothetical protein
MELRHETKAKSQEEQTQVKAIGHRRTSAIRTVKPIFSKITLIYLQFFAV